MKLIEITQVVSGNDQAQKFPPKKYLTLKHGGA